MNVMKNCKGFSLIEIVVVVGILSLLISTAFFIGFPEYDRYVLYCERDYLVDTLLEARAKSFVGGTELGLSVWSNGYCIKDYLGLCITPVHDLPANTVLTRVDFATSTKFVLAFTSNAPESLLRIEINTDQYGFIYGH